MKPVTIKSDRPWYYCLLHNYIVEPPLYKTELENKNKPFIFITKDKTKKIYCKNIN